MQVTPNPDYIKRFGLALADLGVGENERILLAVSGGPDSLALLLLAKALRPDDIVAATVDHQLRPESADEAAFVAQLCNDLQVPHVLLTPAQKIVGNIQSSARLARYELLGHAAEQAACTVIATAHHGDDQLETLLMRLARGSGVDGMAGIRVRNGNVIRPLLGFSKSELEKICADAGVDPIRDPSNENGDYDRVAMRQWLARSAHPFDIGRVGMTASAHFDASEALAWVVGNLAEQLVRQENTEIQCDASRLPRELKRRLLLHCLEKLAPDLKPRGDAIDRLTKQLDAGQTATIGNILCRGGDLWRFSPAPPRRKDA